MILSLLIEILSIIRLFKKKVSIKSNPFAVLKLNVFIFLISIVLLGVAIVYEVNFFNYEYPIPYSEREFIDWSKFKGLNKPHKTLNGSREYAFISTEMDLEITDNAIIIETLFHPSRSYVFNQAIADNNLLTHELYHLHITELWSRKLRKKISQMEDKFNQNLIIEEVRNHKKGERNMQLNYDEKTYHSYLLQVQRSWQNTIDSQLISLKKFSNPNIKLND